jgi:hypothetical protein
VQAIKFCRQDELRSVRIHIVFEATNTGNDRTVVPRLVSPRLVWVKENSSLSGKKRYVRLFPRPQLSADALKKLESDGGGVVALSAGESATIVGLYSVFVLRGTDLRSLAVKPDVLLELDHSYEIGAELTLWSQHQRAEWKDRGYNTRRTASVSSKFSVPNQPKWGACPDEPPFLRAKP